MDELFKIYNECWLLWKERLKYINSVWYRYCSVDSLRKTIWRYKKNNWIINYSDTENQQIKDLKDKINKNSDIRHTIKLDLDLEKNKKDKSIIEKKYQALQDEYWRIQEQLDTLLNVKDEKYSEFVIENKSNTKSESTAVLICSDWHFEENVQSDSVNWLNEYNVEIAEKRIMNLFKNSIKMLNSFELETRVTTLIIALLWDFISGYIHEELMEENVLSPTQAIIKVRWLIKWGIEFMLKNTKHNIIIPCNYWNHWRIWLEKKVSSWYKNSYEWMMYKILEEDFKDNKRVKFQIANGYFNYLTVYDKVLRFHHGDNIKWWGGIWWITIPINNSIKRFNQWRVSDIDIFGHFHQTLSWKNFVVNGSIIWTSAYWMNYWHEEPSQTLILINSKYWKTIHCPIFVKD